MRMSLESIASCHHVVIEPRQRDKRGRAAMCSIQNALAAEYTQLNWALP